MNVWSIIQIALIVTAAAITGVGSRYLWPSLKEDNPIEELSEEVICQQMGIRVDLTPDSPEKDCC